MEPKRILYAEDSPADAELTRQALAAIGLEEQVTIVADGAAVLEYLGQRPSPTGNHSVQVRLVLLDLRMPGMDGLATLAAIRQHPRWKTLPVVMLSHSDDIGDLNRCYEQGANAYVVKPVTHERFAEVIEAVGSFWLRINEPPPQLSAAST